MTLTAFFQYRLSIAQQKGYAKAIQFEIDPLAGAPLPTQVRSHASAVGGKETGRPLKQVHRTNRRDAWNGRFLTKAQYAEVEQAERQLRFTILDES